MSDCEYFIDINFVGPVIRFDKMKCIRTDRFRDGKELEYTYESVEDFTSYLQQCRERNDYVLRLDAEEANRICESDWKQNYPEDAKETYITQRDIPSNSCCSTHSLTHSGK